MKWGIKRKMGTGRWHELPFVFESEDDCDMKVMKFKAKAKKIGLPDYYKKFKVEDLTAKNSQAS